MIKFILKVTEPPSRKNRGKKHAIHPTRKQGGTERGRGREKEREGDSSQKSPSHVSRLFSAKGIKPDSIKDDFHTNVVIAFPGGVDGSTFVSRH